MVFDHLGGDVRNERARELETRALQGSRMLALKEAPHQAKLLLILNVEIQNVQQFGLVSDLFSLWPFFGELKAIREGL